MSSAPRRRLMAWVWIIFAILGRLNTADSLSRDPELEPVFSDSRSAGESGSLGRLFPVPVWRFLRGKLFTSASADSKCDHLYIFVTSSCKIWKMSHIPRSCPLFGISSSVPLLKRIHVYTHLFGPGKCKMSMFRVPV